MKAEVTKTANEPVNVRVPRRNVNRLKMLASSNGLAIADLIRLAISEKLAEWERSKQVVLRGQQ